MVEPAWELDSSLRGPEPDDDRSGSSKPDWQVWIRRKGKVGVSADHCLIQFASNGTIRTRDQAEKFVQAILDGLTASEA